MAAYGALVSLTHIVEHIQRHPFPPITLHQEQVQPIIEKVAFLQDFLENYPNVVSTNLADALERRIADAAVAAQDIILSRIQAIQGGSTSQGETITSIALYQLLQKVLEDLELISAEVMEIKENADADDDTGSSRSTRVDSSTPKGQNMSIVVGLEDVVEEIMDKLTGELPSHRLLISIVGMGGIGKTTLANTIYASPLIVQRFDARAWATISVEYNVQEIFLQLLLCLKVSGGREVLSQLSEYELGEKLHKMLCGRRYFIVLDDLWSFEAWEKVSLFFPDNDNGSRIMITTRLSNLASSFTNSHVHEIKFLDEEKSWDLFCKHVFGGDESCPLELEETGKKIIVNCGGLPLSVVVIGGLLANYKSPQSLPYWEFIAENLSSTVNLMDNERCLKILHTSYTQLPVYLKPCFLYMAIYPQNSLVCVSRLVMLWVAEGIIRPTDGKSLEIAAEEYLHDLIKRNLIIVIKCGSDGKIKFCKMHDLLSDLCSREAENESFYGVATHCSFGIHQSTMKVNYYPDAMSLYRHGINILTPSPSPMSCSHLSLLWTLRYMLQLRVTESAVVLPDPLEGIFGQVNLRYLAMFGSEVGCLSALPSSVRLLWNLQTLILGRSGTRALAAPPEIWKMPQLRHVIIGMFDLPTPSDDTNVVLENLQTLSKVHNFKWSEDAVKRIPNLKKLKVYIDRGEDEGSTLEYYCVDKIGCLNQLESLSFMMFDMQSNLVQHLRFPQSLRKLTLEGSLLQGEDMNTTIGSLPHLQVLKLRFCVFTEPIWETVVDQFCSLEFLVMDTIGDLESWITDSSHFPRLKHLILRDMEKLEKIHSEIGYIPTMQYIELDRCTDSVVVSAKALLEELDNEDLRIRVKLWKRDEQLLNLASHNFVVHP